MSNKEPNTPLIPASSATFTAAGSARINAPAALVFRTIRNTDTWKDWNRFIPKVTIRAQPDDADAADPELADAVIMSTSRALSVDSDIASSLPPSQASRRASTMANGPAAPQPSYSPLAEEIRRNSTSSQASRPKSSSAKSIPEDDVAPDAGPRLAVEQPVSTTQTSSKTTNSLQVPAQGSQFTSTSHSKRGSVSIAAPAMSLKGRLAMNAIYGELSTRLFVNTTLTLHMCMELPAHPLKTKDYAIVVSEIARPADPLDPDELTAGGRLKRSNTHAPSPAGVYRVVWGSDNGALDVSRNRYPKWMLQFQRVMEVRPVYRGDGSEESEVRIWECWKGIASKKNDRGYMGRWVQETAVGLKAFCETFGGAVDRRDFVGH